MKWQGQFGFIFNLIELIYKENYMKTKPEWEYWKEKDRVKK